MSSSHLILAGLLISLCGGCSGYHLNFAESTGCDKDAAACVDAGSDAGGTGPSSSVRRMGVDQADAGLLQNRAAGAGSRAMGEQAGERAGARGSVDAGLGAARDSSVRAAAGSGAAANGVQAMAGTGAPSKPICGNGLREGDELCDGADCPTKCDMPASACVPLVLKGAAKSCDAQCVPAEITKCDNGDKCCPSGCTYATDNDCSQSCGDGVVSGAEKCEPGSTDYPCPTARDCDDRNPCTEDRVTGAECSAECTHTPIMRAAMSCDDGDPCTTDLSLESTTSCTFECMHSAPARPTGSCADSDPCTDDTPVMSKTSCAVECPHARREPPAANCADSDPCTDDKPVMSKTSCAFDCPHGRQTRTGPTSCDDGNPCTRDTRVMSTSACTFECAREPVANGMSCGAEMMCSSGQCVPVPQRCGDGKKQGTEECDDGRETWECDSSCHRTRLYTACGSGSECRNGQGCLSGACTEVCTQGPSGFTCPSAMIPESALGVTCYLESDFGYCRPKCEGAADCPRGLTCTNNVCFP